MLYWVYTLFVFLHGLAHMVYTALASGWIPAAEGVENWTGTPWLLSRTLSTQGTRGAGPIIFTALTVVFVIAAAGLALRQRWATTWVAVAAVASCGALLAFWDGNLQSLTEKGVVGLIINIILLVALFVFRYPILQITH